MPKKYRYRPASSYLSENPEKRQRQLDNLQKGWQRDRKRTKKSPSTIINKMKQLDITPYICNHFYTKENLKEPVKLLDWQREVLTGVFYAGQCPKLAVVGSVKKSGKSALAGAVAQYFLTNKPMAEIYILAPDREAGQHIIFRSLENSIRLHPELRKICKISKDEIWFEESFVKVLACDLSIAGLRSTLTLLDEPWSFRTPMSQRVLDEMTVNPVGDHLTFATTYAGYEEDQGEDLALWKWYSRGRAIEAGDEPPDPNFYFYWKPDYEGIPWGTENYLKHQAKTLRPSTFARFHRNEWAPADSGFFVSADEIDRCVSENQKRGQENDSMVIVGLDIGYRHDASALVCVGQYDERRLACVDHRCFIPKEGESLILQDTVKQALIEWDIEYRIAEIVYDPFQCIHLAQELYLAGFNMQEFKQTSANLHQMCEVLQDLIKNRKFLLYEDDEIRKNLLNSKVKESPQGLKITKSTQSRRIDLTVAMAMACVRAVEYLAPAEDMVFEEVGTYYDFKDSVENFSEGML